jgi:DNA-binding GntR family transcriptional regulator
MISGLTKSQQHALKEIVSYIRRERLPPGTHVPEWTLARLIGTSRSPIRVALECLVQAGAMRYDKNRGYSVSAGAAESLADLDRLLAGDNDPLYLRLAEARLQGQLPLSVTEADLARLLGASRAEVRHALGRAQTDGWVQKEVGYGWRFLTMIDSMEAYDDMYLLRLAIEPAGILSPRFMPDPEQLQALRREQQALLYGEYELMTATERSASNSRFHEVIAAWSNNPFALQTLQRLDRIRHLAEYRYVRQPLPRETVAAEHLRMLDAIEAGNSLLAAALMRQHIDAARRIKVLPRLSKPGEPIDLGGKPAPGNA